ncbi:TetR/AcrR family transcriptional regulator [Kitasatospora sp. NPDC056138]|uniref:TetR/AcrR family transcriptional regulator n=1 Tax=Kitasatospora sp. NPDC056138 TaxID=3345724 RepID=UPI0035D7FB15
MSNPGRRREVLEAVLALLAQVGYERLTMDLVAQRARVGKATLYQRWPSKAELVVAALQDQHPAIGLPDTGSVAEDLRGLLLAWQAGWVERDRGLVLAVLEASRSDPELARLRQERLSRPLFQAAQSVLERARARGQVPAQVDEELLVQLPFALVLMRVLVLDEEPGRELIDRIVDGVLVPLLRTGV